ncbi:MAG: FecR domain-containing protein [Planctomycetia bacterium]|nr:FecR domain-containing protein [Planctomycetia bacterium]
MTDLERLRQLADRNADGTAATAEAAELSALLRNRPDLQDAYLGYLDTHALLCWEFRNGAEQAVADSTAPSRAVAAPKSKVAAWLPWSMAAAATVVAVAALLRPFELAEAETSLAPPPSTIATNAASSNAIVALLVDEAGAEFAAGRAPQGVRVGPGEYELLKGVVHLRFAEGADLVLAGPARLAVTDSLHVRLDFGKVRVIAPPTAKGFTIGTPTADYVDLGTEFGLRVEQDGASDLYVFDGRVNIAEPRSGRVLAEVVEGKSSRCVLGGLVGPAPEMKESDFPNPGAIGFVRWQEYERRMSDDRELLAFFPFRRTTDDSLLTNSQSNHAMSDGRIVGARWTLGRWPGKEALLFERNSDFVQLEVPGEHRELTIAVWLKLDRLDFELNTILNSDRSDRGDVHFQLTRQGLPRGGLLGHPVYDHFVGNPVPVGKWAHVAMAISVDARTQRIYVNGKLARDRPFLGNDVIRPGSCRLGNWLPGENWADSVRALRGRVDEVAIWSRALSEDELKHLVEAGRPELFWNEESPVVAAHR